VANRDHDWETAVGAAAPAQCVSVDANHPLYILYTSGTTGRPKGIVRDHGGHAVALQWTLPNVYGVAPGEVMFTASDVGWVVGHSYIVYGPLINGSTTVLYEGKPIGTPDAGAFWRIVEETGAKALLRHPRHCGPLKRKTLRARALLHITSSRCGPFSWRVSALTPTACVGPSARLVCRCSITGGRPRLAGRSPAIHSVLSRCR